MCPVSPAIQSEWAQSALPFSVECTGLSRCPLAEQLAEGSAPSEGELREVDVANGAPLAVSDMGCETICDLPHVKYDWR